MGDFAKLGWDDALFGIPTGGLYSAAKQGVSLAGGGDIGPSVQNGVGGLANDFMSAGYNHYQEPSGPYGLQNPAQGYGGQYGADNLAGMGFQGMGNAFGNQNYAMGQAMYGSGAQGGENPYLSQYEADSRGLDQAGSLQLLREAAMGQSPSQAAYLMKQGLDQGLANQQAMMGGARGNAGIALAGGNAAANAGAMQNQAYTQAGALRANEMANAMNLYNQGANQMRAQDQNRLGMGNAMSQFNAGQTNQYQMGMGGLGAQYGNMANNWYQMGMHPYDQQSNVDVANMNNSSGNYNQAQARASGIGQSNADVAGQKSDRAWNTGMAIIGGPVSGMMRPNASGSGMGQT